MEVRFGRRLQGFIGNGFQLVQQGDEASTGGRPVHHTDRQLVPELRPSLLEQREQLCNAHRRRRRRRGKEARAGGQAGREEGKETGG